MRSPHLKSSITNAFLKGFDARAIAQGVRGWIKERRWVLFAYLAWSTAIASAIIGSYWHLYAIEHPEMMQYGVLIYTEYEKYIPRIVPLGYVIIIAASLIAGAFLVDFRKVIAYLIASLILSFLIAVLGSFIFVWFVLGVGQNPITLALANGAFVYYVVDYVMLNVLRMSFPLVPIACFLTSIVGAVLRVMFQPSAEV